MVLRIFTKAVLRSLTIVSTGMLACWSVCAPAAADWVSVSQRLSLAGGAVDFTPHGTQPGLNSDLTASENCGGCHSTSGFNPAVGGAYRPFATWSGSMMANATRDPLFWAALDVANHDVPGVGDYCLRCHTSQGWYGGHVVKPGFNPDPNDPVLGAAGCLLDGSYDAVDDSSNDFSGVACIFCHRMMPQGPNNEPIYLDNGNAWVDDQPCANGDGTAAPCRRGPYNYSSGNQPPPHPWAYSEFHTQSAICGVCHNVSTPDTSAGPLRTLKLNDGTDTALPYPVERTYNEWQQSQYSQAPEQTCQACHMPSSEDPNATACAVPGYPNRTGNLPVHAFVGGNTWMPGVIKGEYAEGIYNNGGIDRQASYDQTIAWARDLLGTAAELTTTLSNYTPPGSGAGSMALQVKVTNVSGHKLPTGYAEGRRMWLNLQVKDVNGALVFESGAYDTDTGILTVDSQARVYEILQGIWNHQGTNECDVEDSDGDAMFHFVLNDCIAKDNRIPPLGFQPATTGDPNGYEMRPVAATYPEASPGVLVNYDTVNYTVPVPVGTTGPLTATARLYYQTSSKDYIEFLRDQAIDNKTPDENTMCMGAANRPFTVGPQGRTRGEYVYGLWNGDIIDDRIFGDGFDGVALTRGYGKSPPELMQVASVQTKK